jgi:hypothetical protein
MTVYRITSFPKPPGTKFRYYAQLSCKKSDEKFLDDDNFRGVPFPKKWRRIELFFDEPLWPRADFYNFGRSNFVCNERARKLLASLLEPLGEFLPVTVQGERETHYFYNITNCGAFVDPVKSVRQHLDSSKAFLTLVAPAFQPAAIKKQIIFKIPEDRGTRIYCVEQSDKARKQQFKAIVEDNNLTGLKFEFAWSEKRGPVPWCPPPKLPGSGWITGDGKEFRMK